MKTSIHQYSTVPRLTSPPLFLRTQAIFTSPSNLFTIPNQKYTQRQSWCENTSLPTPGRRPTWKPSSPSPRTNCTSRRPVRLGAQARRSSCSSRVAAPRARLIFVLQRLLSEHLRVYFHDRAGYGYSEVGPGDEQGRRQGRATGGAIDEEMERVDQQQQRQQQPGQTHRAFVNHYLSGGDMLKTTQSCLVAAPSSATRPPLN